MFERCYRGYVYRKGVELTVSLTGSTAWAAFLTYSPSWAAGTTPFLFVFLGSPSLNTSEGTRNPCRVSDADARRMIDVDGDRLHEVPVS